MSLPYLFPLSSNDPFTTWGKCLDLGKRKNPEILKAMSTFKYNRLDKTKVAVLLVDHLPSYRRLVNSYMAGKAANK